MARHPKARNDTTFSFYNLSVLKRAIYYYGPQNVEELVEHVRHALPYNRDLTTIRNVYVVPALAKQRYFKALPDGRWDIEWDLAQAEENNLAERILREERTPISLADIRRRIANVYMKAVEEVQLDLENDPRFAAVGPNHYALSEWHVLNNEAHELLSRDPGRCLTEEEILRRLVSLNQFVREVVVFAPRADSRFKRGPNGGWGLSEWFSPGSKKAAQIEESIDLPTPIVVTPEQMARVTSQAPAIEAYVRSSPEAIRPMHLVEYILGVQVGAMDYAHFVKAVNLFLAEHGQYLRVGPDQWRLKEQVPAEVWEPTARMSAPRVQDLSSPENDEDEETVRRANSSMPGHAASRVRSWKTVLRFINWRDGSLRVPDSKKHLFPSSTENVVELSFLISGSVSNQHRVWLNRETQMLYGLRKLYDALGMMPGSVFHLLASKHRSDQIILHFRGEVDLRVQREQNRLMDTDSLHQRAKAVGRPFRKILIEVLGNKPGGLTFWQIFDHVSHVRPVAIATLRNLLSSLQCFYQTEPGTGRWFFDPGKPTTRHQRTKLRPKAPRKFTRPGRPSGRIPEPQITTDETVHDVPVGSRHALGNRYLEDQRTSVRERVATLLSEGTPRDRALIREYLHRFHGVHIDEGFLEGTVPPPETIRRSRQILCNNEAELTNTDEDLTTVIGKVRALLQDEQLRRDDRRLIVTYYRQFHGIRISEEYLNPAVPAMETIRRSRQILTNAQGIHLNEVEKEESESSEADVKSDHQVDPPDSREEANEAVVNPYIIRRPGTVPPSRGQQKRGYAQGIWKRLICWINTVVLRRSPPA